MFCVPSFQNVYIRISLITIQDALLTLTAFTKKYDIKESLSYIASFSKKEVEKVIPEKANTTQQKLLYQREYDFI